MNKDKTILPTGIIITYNKRGNINTLYSPYMEDLRFNDPTNDTLYKKETSERLKDMLIW